MENLSEVKTDVTSLPNYYEGTILDLFSFQAKIRFDHVAVKMGKEFLTYKELDEKSNELALYLLELGISRESLVTILFPRSLEMIVSIFGVLKAGGAYIPVEPKDGADRIAYILEDSKSTVLITQEQYISEIKDELKNSILEVNFQKDREDWISLLKIDPLFKEKKSLTYFPIKIFPNSLVYLIYTSGTTGKPKGAMIEHRNLFSYITNFIPVIDKHDRTLHCMNPACDSSVGEIFPTLCNGATLILWEDNLSSTIKEEKITYITLTPSMADLVDPADCSYLKKIILGGEKLTPEIVNMFPKEVALYNGYGPTEGTVDASITRIYDANKIHIGGCLPHVRLYVVNTLGKICGRGEAGELWIGGEGVGRGYFNRPELTQEKFTTNPFGDGRIYKTGDLVCWGPEGHLDFLGRIDRQVKVRGFRVELDGLEKLICSFPGVLGSHVVFKNGNLIAYVTSDSLNIRALKEFLDNQLPSYSVPSRFLNLEKFPINSAGKVDEKALPDVPLCSHKEGRIPYTELGMKMAGIWRENIDPKRLEKEFPIYLGSNYFDLGGNSLSAIKLTHAIRRKFLNPNIQLDLIYKNPLLAGYIKVIEEELKKEPPTVGDIPFPIFDLLKALPSTFYFVFAWLAPAIAFPFLVFKFPFLIFYYLFELVFFGLFGDKVPPIFQIIVNKINFDRFNFKEVKIVETFPLDNNSKGLVFCLHPHGLMDIHSLALERYLFEKKIRFRNTFAKELFLLPFNRTFLYLLGYVPAKKDIYNNESLSKKNIFTTPGDVAEFLQCHHPSTVSLSSNKIFFKLALQNGLTLLPIYAFDTEKSFKFYPQLHQWRDKLKIGVQTLAIPIFSGRFYLPIPFKIKTKIVIGSPIKLEKNENPSWEEIEKCVALYSSQLENLYNKNKTGDHPSLNII